MKTLNTYIVYDSNTSIDIFQKVSKEFVLINTTFENDIEKTIDAINNRSMDMLVIDKMLDKTVQAKLNKLVDLIDPELATLELHMNDEDFIRFKLGAMTARWEEAQGDGNINFIDNPQL